MKRLLELASLCLIPALVACTGTGDPPEALVGVWTDCDDGASSFTFGTDGSYAFDEVRGGDEDHVTGTYTADATTLFIVGQDQDGNNVEMEATYYINNTHFVAGASHPQGSHDGVAGTWKGLLRITNGTDTMGVETTMELRADNTGRITEVAFDGSEPYQRDGTWGPSEDPDNIGGYELELQDSEDVTLSYGFQLIDDAVLGTPSHCKTTEQ